MSLKASLRRHQMPIALFLISALAFALRIYQLDAESLWLDEVLSTNLASYGQEGKPNEITLSEIGEDISHKAGPTTHFRQRIWLIISFDAENLYGHHTLEAFRQRAPHSKLLLDEEFTGVEVLLFALN